MKAINLLLAVLIVLVYCNLINAENIAVLRSYKGKVVIIKHKDNKEIKPQINMKLDEKDTIKTGKDGEAQIKFKNGVLYKIGPDKKIKVAGIVKKIKSMKTKKSGALSKFRMLKSKLRGDKKDAKTPTAVAGVRGRNMLEQSKSTNKSKTNQSSTKKETENKESEKKSSSESDESKKDSE